jgi:3-hydroxyacyl-[acyl-carrier-protein] dehydratase
MRLLWVDRVLELERAARALAILELSPEEPTLRYHFPLRPLLPASALIECFAQVGTILLETSHGFTRKALPGYLSSAKFYRPVVPGADVRIEVVAEQWSHQGAVLRSRAEQRGRKCAVCTLGMFTAPLSEFYGPEHMSTYRAMYGQLLAAARLAGFEIDPLDVLSDGAAV